MTAKALLIPVEGPLQEIEVATLEDLQHVCDGQIQALPIPTTLCPGADAATAYVDEEGKFKPHAKPNMRATDFMVPGVGLFWGDCVTGPFLLVGFDPESGEHTPELPKGVEERARLIESEAA